MLDDVEYGDEDGPAAGRRHTVQGQVAGGQVQRDLYVPGSCLIMLDDVEYGGEDGPAAGRRHTVQGQVAAGGQVQRDLYIPGSCLNAG